MGKGRFRWAKIAICGGATALLALIIYGGLHLLSRRAEVIDSIAVLPFENVNADPNTDYLCDGITETIINKLSQLSSLKRVIARNSVFTYKDKTVDAKQVGRELGVSAVLFTRMARLGDRLTISPTLVRTKDNSQLWGERYDRKFEDIFSIIDKCANSEPENALSKFGLLLRYGLLKDREKAFQIMTADLRKTCQRDLEWSYNVAQAFALLDEKKEALDWLENAVDRGFINFPFISKHDTFLDNIRGEERFKKLMERVKYEWEHFEE